MTTVGAIAHLVAKDLRIEARTRRTLSAGALLALLIVTALALAPHTPAGAPALLWIAYLFSGILCFERAMTVERQDGALAGLVLAPIDRSTIFVAKLITNLIIQVALALLITPLGIVFFGLDLSPAPWTIGFTLLLSLVGLAAIGTLFSAAAPARSAGVFLPLLVFPLTLPLAIVASRIVPPLADAPVSGQAVLAAFDLIFLAAGWLAFEVLLDP